MKDRQLERRAIGLWEARLAELRARRAALSATDPQGKSLDARIARWEGALRELRLLVEDGPVLAMLLVATATVALWSLA